MVPAFISLIYTVAPMRLSPLSLSATYPLRVCLSCAKDIIGRKKINNKYFKLFLLTIINISVTFYDVINNLFCMISGIFDKPFVCF